ncbi:MAG: hypothetical protein UZ22_OP11002000868 [Microgenomates bacterium OLB23]|nr:MAG: hypothetical protein UZ22_OP11002000868 [Microgenomates bacterium OLB23]
MKVNMALGAALAVVSLIFSLVTPITLAQESPANTGINLTVSPVFINLLTEPGKETSARIKITNNSNITETLGTQLVKFRPSETGTQPTIEDVDDKDEFASWVSFSDETFNLAPNETKTITVTIKPPTSAALGYYYAVVFKRVKEESAGTTGALVSGAPAVSILLEVKSPQAKREIQIVDAVTDKLFYEYLPTDIKVTIKNTGNIHIIPVGNIFIDWGRKKDDAILTFNEGRGNILPNTERTYTTTWNDGMITRLDGTTHYDITKANKFRIGRYTANILVVYDDGQRDIPLEAQVSFWVFPWKIIAGLALIAMLVLLGIRSTLASGVQKLRKAKKK